MTHNLLREALEHKAQSSSFRIFIISFAHDFVCYAILVLSTVVFVLRSFKSCNFLFKFVLCFKKRKVGIKILVHTLFSHMFQSLSNF